MSRPVFACHIHFPKYIVSDRGVIISFAWKKPRLLKQATTKNTGRLRVNPTDANGVIRDIYVHKFVIETFHGARPIEGMVCRHLDGNYLNNRADNLQWGTHKENSFDRWEHGTMSTGTRHWRTRLTDDDVIKIRQLKKSGITNVLLGELFGIKRRQISSIVNRRAWSHIPS